jgi:hypothetical protein
MTNPATVSGPECTVVPLRALFNYRHIVTKLFRFYLTQTRTSLTTSLWCSCRTKGLEYREKEEENKYFIYLDESR